MRTSTEVDNVHSEVISLAGLSCPYSPIDHEFVDRSVGDYAAEYAELFLERFSPALRNSGQGLTAMIGRWVTNPNATFDDAWSEAHAEVRRAVLARRNVQFDPAQAAVSLAMHLHACGHAGSWDVRLREPASIRLGRMLLPPSREIRVNGDGQQLEMELRESASAERTLLTLHNDDWSGDIHACRQLGKFRAGSQDIVFLPRSPSDADDRRVSLIAMIAACESAGAVLQEFAPPFLPWITKVLRGISPIDGSDGLLRSYSDQDKPGTIGVSFPASEFAIAEMFVHEASHQYVHIATRIGPIVDGSDRSMYFSPVKGTERPISAILLAFHAFANVVLFYESCIRHGAGSEHYCRQNIDRHSEELKTLLRHLRATTALTDIGTSLIEPVLDFLNRHISLA